ncbi:reverse transcriptase domain-containing protein, partial [Tanacetum coccineum]
QKRFPDHCTDVGIAEQHVGICVETDFSACVKKGSLVKVFVATLVYKSFLEKQKFIYIFAAQMGKYKKRIQLSDITINIGKGEPILECPIPVYLNQSWPTVTKSAKDLMRKMLTAHEVLTRIRRGVNRLQCETETYEFVAKHQPHGMEVVLECKFAADRIQIHTNGKDIHFFLRGFDPEMLQTMNMSLMEAKEMVSFGRESSAPRSSSGLLTPKPTLNLDEIPPFLPEPLVRLPLSMSSSQQILIFTPLMTDPIVHILVMDICSSIQAYLPKCKRYTKLLISGSSQLSSVLGNVDGKQNVIAAGSRGLYGGATVVKHAIANSIAAMA